MTVTHLVDSSVVKRLNRPPVAFALAPFGGRLARPTMVDLEVGYSARNGAEWDALTAPLAEFERIATDAAHIDRALEVQRMLAERSQRGRRIADLVIAAAAERAGLTLLHYDADFDLIAAVTGQAVEWIVPRGTVD
ncbi:MAG: PIN domain nuclease [Sporichthyaceae bacterium]